MQLMLLMGHYGWRWYGFYWLAPVLHHQATPGSPVLAAGDPERGHLEEIKELGGIPYHLNVVNFMVRALRNRPRENYD